MLKRKQPRALVFAALVVLALLAGPIQSAQAAATTGVFVTKIATNPAIDVRSATVIGTLDNNAMSGVSTTFGSATYVATGSTPLCTNITAVHGTGGTDVWGPQPFTPVTSSIPIDPSWVPTGWVHNANGTYTKLDPWADSWLHVRYGGRQYSLWYEANYLGGDPCQYQPMYGGTFAYPGALITPLVSCPSPWGGALTYCGNGSGSGIAANAGAITRDEILAGSIPHALMLSSNMTMLSSVAGAFRSPAWKSDGVCQRDSDGTPCSFAVPEGARLQLNPTYNVNGLTCTTLAFTGCTATHLATAKAVLKALQTYGAFVTDKAGGNCNWDGSTNYCGGGVLTFEASAADRLAWDYAPLVPPSVISAMRFLA